MFDWADQNDGSGQWVKTRCVARWAGHRLAAACGIVKADHDNDHSPYRAVVRHRPPARVQFRPESHEGVGLGVPRSNPLPSRIGLFYLVERMKRASSIYNFHFDIVQGCQLRCLGCPNSTLLPKVKRISVDDFDLCLSHVDVEWVHTLRLFSFGEPLLHKELSRIVARIPKQQWKVSIVELSTNAQQVYWDDFEEMLKLEVVNRLVVSCDGDGTPEEYERLRPPSRWENLLEFLERARRSRDRWSPATQLVTRTVINKASEKERWQNLLRPLGWSPEFRGWMSLPEAAENMVGREPQIPDGVCFFLADPEIFTAHPWGGQVNLLHVNWDGTVVPCCAHPNAGDFGNLKHQTYNQILAGEARRRFIQTMQEDRRSMPICNQCEMGPAGNEGPSFSAAFEI